MTERRFPFQNLGPQEWRNLAVAALFAFYAVYLGIGLYRNGLFVYVGADYLVFWGAGYIANTRGYAHAYDLNVLREIQEPLVPMPDDPDLVFTPMLMLAPPVFILPFQALALLPAKGSLFVWTVFNALLLFLYLRFFGRRIAPESLSDRLSVMMCFSFPPFWTLVWGQVNILLLACVGEFLRAMVTEKPFRAGFWLGGLWLKPQTLVLILPALLLQRAWKALIAFGMISLIVWGSSIGIGGPEASRRMLDLWLSSAVGMPTNNPQHMSNWRMVGIHLSSLVGPPVGWGIALTGLGLTLLVALSFWIHRQSPRSPQFGIALLGTLAATGVATWHSHIHMMTILIPPLLYLKSLRRLTAGDLDLWLFLMPALVLAGFLLDLMGELRVLPFTPSESLQATGLAMNVTGFGLNLYFFFWSTRHLYKKSR